MNISRKQKTISSTLWAAYGDVLGFPTELASASMIMQRLGSTISKESRAWKRLVGGRFGAQVDLCLGAYSDDTQLRLATSRSIGPDGYFDVESFAKVELPVWLSYALGAGRGSKAAASSLSDRSTNWFSNFYEVNGADYVKGGGNGAAMRIQPHVWAAQNLADERAILAAVVRNSICTHGHLRGIGGAMVHAIALARVLRFEELPKPTEWIEYADVIRTLPELIAADSELSTFWLPTWERRSETRIEVATSQIADEWVAYIKLMPQNLRNGSDEAYRDTVMELGGFSDAERGSGLKSAFFSMAACWFFRDMGPRKCIESIVNCLGSDTDTIATMAGAIFGALPNQRAPDDTIQDSKYLEAEAVRLFDVSQRSSVSDRFNYPDLLYWQAPKVALDCVSSEGGKYSLSGFGPIDVISEEFSGSQKGTVWQWFQLPFGQTILCKRRTMPRSLPKSNESEPKKLKKNEVYEELAAEKMQPKFTQGQDLFSNPNLKNESTELASVHSFSLDQVTDQVIRANFESSVVGGALLRICEEENAIELAIAFAAIVAKARRARIRKGM